MDSDTTRLSQSAESIRPRPRWVFFFVLARCVGNDPSVYVRERVRGATLPTFTADYG